MKVQKIVVSGGSGFMGLQLVRRLEEINVPEILLIDVKEPPKPYKKYYQYCDILNHERVSEVTDKADIVYHLAGNSRPGMAEENPHWDLRINAIGTINMAQACLKHHSKLIFSSSAQVNYSPRSCYSISKKTAEEYILHYVEKKQLNACICRFWNVYGPTQDSGFVIVDFIKKLNDNPSKLLIRGNGLAMRDFVYIDDLLDALILVAEKGETGRIYEIGSGNQITILQLAEKIAKAMNLDPLIVPEQKAEGNRPIPHPKDLSNITKLGWRPKHSLEDGLEKTIFGVLEKLRGRKR